MESFKEKYSKEISGSEAKYKINDEGYFISFCKGGGQGSYNLPMEFINQAIKNNVIKEDENFDYVRKEQDGPAYILSPEYKFELGEGIIWIIGREYKERNNKFIASCSGTNGKFQMYRRVYNKLDKNEYEWFVKLYDNNLIANNLEFEIDYKEKKLKLEVEFNSIVCNREKENHLKESSDDEYGVNIQYIPFAHNRIIFGAPGTGKSHKLDKDRIIFEERFERVTFHPNYSYGQFVGTYKPVPITEIINGEKKATITYKYVPGPFMRIYVKAKKSIEENNPKSYLLLIEEINRANVASVFGDVFQLLDRKDGESEYEIETSEDMRAYLASELSGKEEDYKKIKIPKNMYIWSTMNSADQGVFPMDTAFKRRWNFEYIGIDDNSEGIKDIVVKMGEDRHDVNWDTLRRSINNKLCNLCKVEEDKLLGPYFLSKDIIKTFENNNYVYDNEKFLDSFKSKVLMYLYEDVAKHYRERLFENCTNNYRYSLICEAFDKYGEKIFGDEILSENGI